ncbi:MAG: hypothetical protein ACXW5U_26850 [Thermoanaerobaculia bacterium]
MSGGLQIERIQEQMRRLRLGPSVEQLPSLLEAAARSAAGAEDGPCQLHTKVGRPSVNRE